MKFSKRFSILLYASVAVTGITFISMFKDMESVAVIGVTGLCGIIAWYTKMETDRPSK